MTWVERNGPFLFVSAVTVAILISDGLRPAGQASTPPPLTIAYAPEDDLERLDVGLIDEARDAIDVAAYVLTDRAVAAAIERAGRRGVGVRIVLDSGAPDLDAGELIGDLAATPNIEVRIKPKGEIMHLKAYAVDGKTVRLGSANFSRSGETRQDNELAIIRSAAEAQKFEAAFAAIWRQAK